MEVERDERRGEDIVTVLTDDGRWALRTARTRHSTESLSEWAERTYAHSLEWVTDRSYEDELRAKTGGRL